MLRFVMRCPAIVVLFGIICSLFQSIECKPSSTTSPTETSTAESASANYYEAFDKQQSSNTFHAPLEPGDGADDDSVEGDATKDAGKKGGKKLPDFRWSIDPTTMTKDIEIEITFKRNNQVITTIELVKRPDGSVQETSKKNLQPKKNSMVVSGTNDFGSDDEDEDMFKNIETLTTGASVGDSKIVSTPVPSTTVAGKQTTSVTAELTTDTTTDATTDLTTDVTTDWTTDVTTNPNVDATTAPTTNCTKNSIIQSKDNESSTTASISTTPDDNEDDNEDEDEGSTSVTEKSEK